MTGARMRPALVGLLLSFLAVALRGVQCEDEQVPSEDLCRPYIEKALKDLGTGSLDQTNAEIEIEIDQENHLIDDEEVSPMSEEAGEAANISKEDQEGSVEEDAKTTADETKEATEEQTDASEEKTQKISEEEEQSEEAVTDKSIEISIFEEEEAEKAEEASTETTEDEGKETDSFEKVTESEETRTEDEKLNKEKSDEETKEKDEKSEEVDDEAKSEENEESKAEDEEQSESKEATEEVEVESNEEAKTQQTSEETNIEEESDKDEEIDSKIEEDTESIEDQTVSAEDEKSDTEEKIQNESAEAESEEKDKESTEDAKTASSKDIEEETKSEEAEAELAEEEEGTTMSAEEEMKLQEEETKSEETETKSTEEEDAETEEKDAKSEEEDVKSEEDRNKDIKSRDKREIGEESTEADGESEEVASDEEQKYTPEEDLIQEIEIPENLRPRDHINQLLKMDEENEEKERAIQREADIILRDLKRLYDNAIKPLETMYKYRDLSNRHFGDPEIFSKPLVLFMGPWSGGKSSIINYLLDIEYKTMSLRTGGLRKCLEEHCKSPNGKNDTGAEPSPAYFNIIMHGEEEEVLDGTQLAADWTFSGLQKFGQGLLDRLRGLRFNNKLLEKVNIVEIPGILEIRKQVQRLFPFNDACQWFIDRADIIFLVYDPAKLDVGPETEAILDQLKGREYQTRIILNKADQVKPEELMRVQGALIWNISPLMSSAEPPIMYSTSLWSLPYEAGAPIRLLYAQERAFLRDLRSAINKRVEHKIASARRFAVRVRNHAKMVDCYLTTYYNHKTFFGNKREISDRIIENPQDYHIYEGLSTLTNISRYDLPDPDVYRDFFRLNPLYDFPLLSSTCTYFRGCPINRLDVSIAYDLPELVGKYKKSVEAVLHESEGNSPPS
ncbi:PREDICTED: sarcalumenin isoform X2 [Cyphomyrmex costatus]|uniref:sarcalumenin isoform X2 n=1 Tax=Cyphomyrmex costatus TaxID=456900 RepID=UPI0008523D41|nr:PREDICTED: sarcalumenin isoform X2 [Cyphomyrmex costatus]